MFKTENDKKVVFLDELFDTSKYQELIEELKKEEDIDQETKKFLMLAATRFIDFNYYKVAQYYYNLEEGTVKNWFKKLNLVLVNDKDAIENGYVKLSKKIIDNLSDYTKEK